VKKKNIVKLKTYPFVSDAIFFAVANYPRSLLLIATMIGTQPRFISNFVQNATLIRIGIE